jgi:hypothetical protein
MRGIGVMVREVAVDIGEKFEEFTAERFEQVRREAAGRAIAGIDYRYVNGDSERAWMENRKTDRQFRQHNIAAI